MSETPEYEGESPAYNGPERRQSDRRGEDERFQAYRANVLDVRDVLFRMRGWLIGVCLLLFVTLSIVLYMGAKFRAQTDEIQKSTDQRVELGQQNNELLKDVEGLTKQLNDCLTPTGTCSQRQRASSQNLSTAIAFCAATLPKTATVSQTLDCVVTVLKGKESDGG